MASSCLDLIFLNLQNIHYLVENLAYKDASDADICDLNYAFVYCLYEAVESLGYPQSRVASVLHFLQPTVIIPRIDSLKRHVKKVVDKFILRKEDQHILLNSVTALSYDTHCLTSVGPLCTSANITPCCLEVEYLSKITISNGIFIEIIQFMRKQNKTWQEIANLFHALKVNCSNCANSIRQKYISVVHKKFQLGKTNVLDKIQFLSSPLNFSTVNVSKVSDICVFENKKLAKQLSDLKLQLNEANEAQRLFKELSDEYHCELVKLSDDVSMLETENDELCQCLQSEQSEKLKLKQNLQNAMLNYTSAKCQEKKTRDLIAEISLLNNDNEISKSHVQDLESSLKEMKHFRDKYRSLLHYYKQKCTKSTEELLHLKQSIIKLENSLRLELGKNAQLKIDAEIALENRHVTVIRDENNKITDNVRQLIAYLHSKNIATDNIPNVIKQIGTSLFNTNINDLPSEKTCRNIVAESNVIAKLQVANYLNDSENPITVHYDGTSDKQRRFYGIQVTCDAQNSKTKTSKILTGQISEVSREDADTEFCELKNFFKECAELLEPNNSVSKFQELYLKYGSNMSDRSVVNSKLHKLEQELKDTLLNENVPENNKTKIFAKIQNFKCAVHPLLTLADNCDKCLQDYEKIVVKKGNLGHKSLPEFKFWASKDKSHAFSLLRTVSKSLASKAHAAAGRPEDWKAYIDSLNKFNFLVSYERQRFNVPFQAAAGVFYHKNDILDFVESCADCNNDNKLFRALAADIKDTIILAELRAIGIIWHQFTEPYYRLTKSSRNILELNTHFENMIKCLENIASDPKIMLLKPCQESMFENIALLDTPVTTALYESYQHEDMTKEAIKLIIYSFLQILKRQLKDQLEGGKFFNPSADVVAQACTAVCSNMRGESDFGSLKRQRLFSPNASTLSHETSIMWERNDPNQYLNTLKDLDPNRYKGHMQLARKLSDKIVKKYRNKSKEIKMTRQKIRKDKEQELLKKAKKKSEERDSVVKRVYDMGGPVNSHSDVVCLLQKNINASEKEKIELLKLQIKYFKIVIMNPVVPKQFYSYTCQNKKLKLDDLRDNLVEIVNSVNSNQNANCENVASVEITTPEERDVLLNTKLESLKPKSVTVCKASVSDDSTSKVKRKSVVKRSLNEQGRNKNLPSSVAVKKRKKDCNFVVNSAELKISSFVAVAFSGCWFPGEITAVSDLENSNVTVNYMHPHVGDKYVWPNLKDEQVTDIKFIFKLIEAPIPTGAGRGNYVTCIFSEHSEIQKEYMKYCTKFNMH